MKKTSILSFSSALIFNLYSCSIKIEYIWAFFPCMEVIKNKLVSITVNFARIY